ncbi:alpha/beta hydrolase [Hymenobacter negativus]|uniref:Alpha/beta hydrolase n=1 Tax=Hymenobacter negativus TaxID=2795026 RepID=A0ABS3QGW6_9BACT|nr:alpha/beta hydrolase [Hymenobacter negativus]MBO2009970.1 alpha/beta hydrolase [Hymenobacter negativus]
MNSFPIKRAAFALLSVGLLQAGDASAQAPAKNIVLVHGAFADGSGWEGVANILKSRGYTVTIVQNPLTSLDDDVAAVNRALVRQNGPTVLVGHSWAGSVITQAGASAKVASLVYVNAYQPDAGETTLQWAMSAPPAPENGILPPDESGFIYYDQAKFHAGFCADVSKEKAAFMYASQGPVAAKCFGTPLTQAAWKTKPAWAVLARDDKSINPDIQRKMYQRSHTTVTELRGSHVVFIAQPKAVADVIEAAAKGASQKQ